MKKLQVGNIPLEINLASRECVECIQFGECLCVGQREENRNVQQR